MSLKQNDIYIEQFAERLDEIDDVSEAKELLEDEEFRTKGHVPQQAYDFVREKFNLKCRLDCEVCGGEGEVWVDLDEIGTCPHLLEAEADNLNSKEEDKLQQAKAL